MMPHLFHAQAKAPALRDPTSEFMLKQSPLQLLRFLTFIVLVRNNQLVNFDLIILISAVI
jgi:hypothetical protein